MGDPRWPHVPHDPRMDNLWSLRISGKKELEEVLLNLIPAVEERKCVILHAVYGELDAASTYGLNARAGPGVALPGFGEEALRNHPYEATDKFEHFARSMFGQRKWFTFLFKTPQWDKVD